ncbi:MAG: N(4)-(beta-N-acetylglucosaminyl)-L-asparaginase [Anaerolineae bacterium]
MIIITSSGGEVGIAAGMEVLRAGGSALDAVEAATRLVEADLSNHSVGIAGWPNILGWLELDASIMDGRTLNAGAVGALQGYAHPISVARQVLERLPHVLLAGEGAARFAREVGAEEAHGLTPEAWAGWERWLEENIPAEVRRQWPPAELAPWVRLTCDPTIPRGTVNVLAQDAQGHLASAVSTSGWAWKHPGRLGDSPIIGAGNYCDDRYGAAACTGVGEWAIRGSTAGSIIFYCRQGLSMRAACAQALRDLDHMDRSRIAGNLNILALDREGQPHGATTNPAGTTYWIWEGGAPAPEERHGETIPL